MRDLSKMKVGGRRKAFSPKKYLRFLIIGFVAVVVIFLAKTGLNSGGFSSAGVLLREAETGLVPVELSGDHEELVENAIDLATDTASVSDVRYGGRADATITRSYGGGTYILNAEATLPDPVNQKYHLWLVGGDEVIPIDYMRGAGTEWSLNIRTVDNYSNYDEVWITLERTNDGKPEELILEGSF